MIYWTEPEYIKETKKWAIRKWDDNKIIKTMTYHGKKEARSELERITIL